MSSMWAETYDIRCERMRQRKAKLIAKGLNPRSEKFFKLLYRGS